MATAVHPSLTNSQLAFRPRAARRPGLVEALGGTLRLWRRRIRERQAFASLGDRDVRDLGVSRWELEREAAKPFWRD